jgi:hypothetical protein
VQGIWQAGPVQPTRRSVLVAGALGAVSACTSKPGAAPQPVPPDTALTATAVARETALLAAYDEVLAAVPALAARLAPVRAEHQAHLAALQGAPTIASPLPVRTGTSLQPAAALTRLAALERAAATAHAGAAVSASRRLAPLLASLAASESAHLVLL